MSAEGMTIDEALAHANCSAALSSSPAHVAEALQVLAARVAELEAQQGRPTGTDWAVRWPDQETDHDTGIDRYVQAGTDDDLTGEAYARRVHSQYPRETELISRTLGPWRVSS